MEFRQCSIAGRRHAEASGNLLVATDDSARHFEPVVEFHVRISRLFTAIYYVRCNDSPRVCCSIMKPVFALGPKLQSCVEDFFLALALCHTVQVSSLMFLDVSMARRRQRLCCWIRSPS